MPRPSSRAPSETATAGCSRARRRSSRSARGRPSRSSSRAPAARARVASRASSSRPARKASSRVRSRASSGSGRRTRRSCRSTACACRTRIVSASSTAAFGWRCRRSTSAGSPRGRLCRDRAGMPRRLHRILARAPRVRAADRGVPARAGAARRNGGRDRGRAAARLARRGARRRAREAHARSSVAKLYASEVSVRAANSAVQVFGGYGYVDEYPSGSTSATRASRRSTRARARSRN